MVNRAIIQRSLDYIEENLQTDITAAELAQAAGFSLFHYYRLFQQATGLPVMQYILRRRLLHGVYAMNRGESKLDAALGYGFDTYPGFYKAFCREFGSTPTEFLEANRAKRPYRIDITREEHMTITHKKPPRSWKTGTWTRKPSQTSTAKAPVPDSLTPSMWAKAMSSNAPPTWAS